MTARRRLPVLQEGGRQSPGEDAEPWRIRGNGLPTRADLGERSKTYNPAVKRGQLGRRRRRRRKGEEPQVEPLRYADGEPATFPKTRGECKDGPRPCPWARCRHHLAVDEKFNYSLTFVFPERELEDLPDTCSLDVADRGPHSELELGLRMNLVAERAGQMVEEALEDPVVAEAVKAWLRGKAEEDRTRGPFDEALDATTG